MAAGPRPVWEPVLPYGLAAAGLLLRALARRLVAGEGRRILALATASGLLVTGLWLARGWLGSRMPLLVEPAGLLEAATPLLALSSAALCAAAIARWRRHATAPRRAVPLLHAALALLLLVFAVGQLGWGQGALALRDVADPATLAATWRVVAAAFVIGTLVLCAWGLVAASPVVAAIAPSPALLPLALIAAYAGLRLSPGMFQALLAIFFTFHAWHLLRSAPRGASPGGAACATRPAAASAGRAWRALKVLVAIGLLAALLHRFDWQQAAREAAHISLLTLAGVFVALAIGLALSAWKWSRALRMHELRYPFHYLLRVLCTGFFLNSFLPTAVGGDAYRVYRTLPPDQHRSRALSAVLIERASGFGVLLLLGGGAALALFGQFALARLYALMLAGTVLATALAVLVARHGSLSARIFRWLDAPALQPVHHNLQLLRARGSDWLVLLAASLAFQAISIGADFVLLSALDPDVTLAQCILITAFVGIAAVLPLSIGGLGVMEGAFVGAAVGLGLDFDQALVVAVARRLIAVALGVLCGTLYLAESLGSRDPHSARDPACPETRDRARPIG